MIEVFLSFFQDFERLEAEQVVDHEWVPGWETVRPRRRRGTGCLATGAAWRRCRSPEVEERHVMGETLIILLSSWLGAQGDLTVCTVAL